MSSYPEFPAPGRLGKRLVWTRHEIENYKLALIGMPPVDRDPNEPIVLVSAKQLETELPFGRRWLGKLVQGRFRDLPVGEDA